ncbi:MAG: rhodanese-like domain-containing protein [Alphaproteobacteria bacterium]|nr:rhodanese-like domain-containing protein [Alphaproteobacteria bacterium]
MSAVPIVPLQPQAPAAETPPRTPEVDALTVEQWRKAGHVAIVDVREQDEFDEERIPGALLFPKSAFDPAALPRFDGKKLVLVCLAGKRSLAVGEILQDRDRVEALSLQGGMLAWMAAGLPVETGTS